MITNKMEATLIPNKGSDLIVVNAARVSFKKENTEFTTGDEGLIRYLATHDHWTPFSHCRDAFALFMSFEGFGRLICNMTQEEVTGLVWMHHDAKFILKHSLYGWAKILNRITDEKMYADERLREIPFAQFAQVYNALKAKYPVSAKYLIKESPYFGGFDRVWEVPVPDVVNENPYFVDVTIRQKVPIFVARQDFKHMVGRTFNEVSRRYVDDEPEVYLPDVWRAKAENKKQGSLDEPAEFMYRLDDDLKNYSNYIANDTTFIVNLYENLIANLVCPEQARMILPQGMMTEYYVTANLAAWNRMIKQRKDSHAQKEIQDLAVLVEAELVKYDSQNKLETP